MEHRRQKSRMDPIHAASELRRLLIIHDKIGKQLQQLDYKIESISRCLFANGLDGTSRDMSIYYLRLSVANGTKIMLEKCRGQLIQQVKKLSCQIIESLQSDIMSNVSQTSVSQTSVSQTEHTVPPGMTDTAAIQYTYAMTSACRSV